MRLRGKFCAVNAVVNRLVPRFRRRRRKRAREEEEEKARYLCVKHRCECQNWVRESSQLINSEEGERRAGVASRRIASRRVASHRVTSRHVTSRTSRHVTSRHVTSHCISSHRIASHRIASHRFASHRVASRRVASRRVASRESPICIFTVVWRCRFYSSSLPILWRYARVESPPW